MTRLTSNFINLGIFAFLSSYSLELQPRQLASLNSPSPKRISECYAYDNTYFCNHKNRDVDLRYGIQGWCCPLDDEDSNIPECQTSIDDDIECNLGKETQGELFYHNNVGIDQTLCGFSSSEGGDILEPTSEEQTWEVSQVQYYTLDYPVYDESCYFQVRVDPTYATGVVDQNNYVQIDFTIINSEVFAWSGLTPDDQGNAVDDGDGTIYNGNSITFGLYDSVQIIFHPHKNVDAEEAQPYLLMTYSIADAVYDETLVVVEEEEPEPEPVIEVEEEEEVIEEEPVVEIEEEEEDSDPGLQLSDQTIFYIQIGVAIWCALMLICGVVYCGSKCISIKRKPQEKSTKKEVKNYTGSTRDNEERFRKIDQKKHGSSQKLGTSQTVIENTYEDVGQVRLSSQDDKNYNPYKSDQTNDDKKSLKKNSRQSTKIKLSQVQPQSIRNDDLKSTLDRDVSK